MKIYRMKLNNDPFNLIKSGNKTVELRLNDEKRQLLDIGDIIIFENRNNNYIIRTKIIRLSIYKNFKELYSHFDKESMGYTKTDKANYRDMEEYYSIKDINEYGVIAIEIKLDCLNLMDVYNQISNDKDII